MTIPQKALDAIDAALAELPQPPRPQERDRWRIVSRIALAAAAPHIAAAERERIRHLAIKVDASSWYDSDGSGIEVKVPFADLLTEAP